MKRYRLSLSFALFLLPSFCVFGDDRCPAEIAPLRYHSLPHSHIGVSTLINGFGPYEFMVDTGAQITVIEPALARELALEAAGSINIVTVASRVEVPLVSATVVAVGSVSVKSLNLAVEDLGPIQADYRNLRGILGNNFLSRFDLLIDNRHRMLCFDDSGRMQQSLRGEHVPILAGTAAASNSASADAVLVFAQLPDNGKQRSILRLDSGSNIPLLYVDHSVKTLGRIQGSSIGKQAQFVYTHTPERNVRLGTQKEMRIAFAKPAGNRRLYSKSGEDGVLPTGLFKRVFISSVGQYVIFDPDSIS